MANPAGLYLACWILSPFPEATINSVVEPSRSSEMSPLQVMVCYVNSPAVVLSIFITARAGLNEFLKPFKKSSSALVSMPAITPAPILKDNVVPFRKRNSDLAA